MVKVTLLDLNDVEKLTASLAKKLKLKNQVMDCSEALDNYLSQSDDFPVIFDGDKYLNSDDVFCVLADMYEDEIDEKEVDELVPVLIEKLK